ncbi:MAG: ABC transporter ATP-binding protein [Thermodesulfobacteriota bacterium]
MAFIEIEKLHKGYCERRRRARTDDGESCFGQEITVLDDINLQFEQGELVTILGPSGCGKSTMLRLIAGFDPDFSGLVKVAGKPVHGPSNESIFVFQHNGLMPWLTVQENVELGIRFQDKLERAEAAALFIGMVELDGFEEHYPHQLSIGMQRRAELARALVVSPELLIMDEPFSGLDFLTHMKIREEVVNMHQFFHQTILLVTHNIDDALIMGDRVVVLGDRPTSVKLDRRLDFDHPRDPKTQAGLQELRDEIFLMLGVSYAV